MDTYQHIIDAVLTFWIIPRFLYKKNPLRLSLIALITQVDYGVSTLLIVPCYLCQVCL